VRQNHQEFQVGFIWWAIGIAIFGGFMLGAHIAMQIGFNLSLPRALDVWIQTHGHLQLAGWVGLFIIGVSLHFIPRLTSVPIEKQSTLKTILFLTVSGLLIRTNFEFWSPYVENEKILKLFTSSSKIGNVIEFLGTALYLATLLKSFLKATEFKRKGFNLVKPYFLSFIIGWIIYWLVQLLEIFLDRYEWFAWNKWSINVFMKLSLFPISFAFSILNFPLYIHLAPPRKILKHLGYVYFLITLIYEISSMPIYYETLQILNLNLFAILGDVLILLLLFASGIIGRIFLPDLYLAKSPFWRRDGINEVITNVEKKPRKGYSDYGEFGKFELLIYSAYIWLLISLFLDLLARCFTLFGLPIHYGDDPIRHSFLLGFITLLILGMAQRMLPGFMHKNKIANKKFVFLTFLLGNISVISRVLPTLIPHYLSGFGFIVTKFLLILFALSGFIGIISLIFLFLNLRSTFKG
jgi:uncharacterized protein involved in response to NO